MLSAPSTTWFPPYSRIAAVATADRSSTAGKYAAFR